ncbi:hypothetical protein H9Q08_17295 [Chryseobacterium sp. PS-8]|uniref:TonB-dependent receptor n=1 Tax=Chryseobacterium indicum TaxID=2766954 RepID=A0ABS9C900_9FLAO|nr:hypothetical protein [Chryseobacterium sp. PS-8]MCF2221044.1 hypothetical protein [Chryseobacterium sp. PS-8]
MEKVQEIQEVKIEKNITYKKDTTVYNLNQFSDKTERKVGELIKKLPGVEVTKDGIKVNGQKIEKITVNNQDIFAGNQKASLENLPAEAFEKLEVIGNFSESKLLKGFGETNNRNIINLKLKKEYEGRIFGEISAGKGNKNYYSAHANLVKIVKKGALSGIFDSNNSNEEAISSQELMMKTMDIGLLFEDTEKFFQGDVLKNFDIFSNPNVFKSNDHSFLVDHSRNINKWSMKAFLIGKYNELEKESGMFRKYYQNGNLLFEENSDNSIHQYNTHLISQIKLNKSEANSEDRFTVFFKYSNSNTDNQNNFSFFNLNRSINKQTESGYKNLSVNYEKVYRHNPKQLSTLLLKVNMEDNENNQDFLSPDNVFPIGIAQNSNNGYRFFQNQSYKKLDLNFDYKFQYKISSLDILKFNAKSNSSTGSNKFNLAQNTDQENIDTSFGDLGYFFSDNSVALEYQRLINKVTIKARLTYENIYKENQQSQIYKSSKNYILPRLDLDWTIKPSYFIKGSYSISTSIPTAENYFENYLLRDYNILFKGNPDLENTLFQNAYLLLYRRIEFYKLNYSLSMNYSKQINGFTMINLQTLNLYQMYPILLNNLSEMYKFSANVEKQIKKVNFKLGADFSDNTLKSINNEIVQDNKTTNLNINFKINSLFKENPNFTLETQYDNRKNIQGNGESNIFRTFNLNFDTKLKVFKYFFISPVIEYKHFFDYSNYKNYTIANLNLSFVNPDKNYSFDLIFKNIFNQKYLYNSSFNNQAFMVTQYRIFPFTAMLKMNYNF